MSRLEEVRGLISSHLEEISAYFIDGAHLTFIARQPRLENADMIITEDDPKLVIESIQKTAKLGTSVDRLRYLGALGLLCEASVYVPEDVRECIESALEDACADGSLKWKRILNRYEIEPVFK